MSALNHVDDPSVNKGTSAENDLRPASKRRSSRVVIDIPVILFGQNPRRRMFEEKTKTLTVSAHGALISLKTEIDPQKPVIIANPMTGMEVQCRVAHRKELGAAGLELGLEFSNPLPKFWGIHFPPEDWNPAERKKASSPQRPAPIPTRDPRR